jgi:pyruvate dehydrogenase E2 component (dihydrolipoamide acetyltransferase)
MAKEVRLPQLGQTMEEGTIVNCLISVGDEVKKGDVIFEIETDKATLEMEAPADGFVKHILVEIDQTLPIGEPLLVLGDKDEEVPQNFIDSLKGGAPAAPSEAAPVEQAAPAAPQPAAVTSQPAPTAGKVLASPRAKKLAGELDVDLANVTGTGPAGKITEQDVKQAAASTTAKPAATAPSAPAPVAQADVRLGATVPMNRLQKITAERMLKSKREIPCFYLTVKANVTGLVDFRTKLNQTSEVKVSYNDFIIKAVATGLERYPIMTGLLAGESIMLAETINVGLAISVPDGLVAPILKDVNKKDVKQIARDSQALVERARSNKLTPTDLEGGCITVSNLGAFGIDNFIPIVVPGQCSILGIGQITDTCVPDNGNIMLRKLMNMTLSVDHKVANGAYAAQFLDFVRKLLEDTSTFNT